MTDRRPETDVSLATLIRDVAEARHVPFELLCSAVEESLGAAYREQTGSSSAIARIDREAGDFEIFERRRVVDVVSDPSNDVAKSESPGYEVGDFLDRPVSTKTFARAAALTAKRVVLQRCVEFERERVYAHFKELEGQLVSGLVQREVNGAVYVLLDDRNEAALPPWERSPRDRFQINDRVVCELRAVKRTRRGPALLLSRASERFVRLLVDSPNVVRAAREPGRLTMLLVTGDVGDIGPAAAAMHGERIELVRMGTPMEILRSCFGAAAEMVDHPELDVVLAVSEQAWVWDRAPLAARLAERRVVPVQPGDLDAVLTDLQAEEAVVPAPAEALASAVIDPALIAKLEQFAREREARQGETSANDLG